jgi:glycerol-3-phosphate acyltransferase PlsY
MILLSILCFFLSYLLGSIPFGLLIVRFISHKDVRAIGSGRTGGTNAYRASGTGAGVLTALLDGSKGVASGFLSAWLVPGNEIVKVLCVLATIVGHNYSLFLLYRNGDNKLRFHGGAGGATCFGGTLVLWWPAIVFLIPVTLIVFFLIGYASLTTISIALTALIIFTVRWVLGWAGWQDILFGAAALLLVTLALLPNLRRLLAGTERRVGLHTWLARKKNKASRFSPGDGDSAIL